MDGMIHVSRAKTRPRRRSAAASESYDRKAARAQSCSRAAEAVGE
jgi:hypothetical protein